MRRIIIAALIPLPLCAVPAKAQSSCNPVIDGTYCEQYPPRGGSNSSASSRGISLDPIRPSLADDLSSGRDTSPATLGAITFRGDGSQCIGLFRRGKCN